jgi:GNAT superfamily N-acetyltransferase
MSMEHTLIAQPPQAFTETEIHDFLAMVRAGEEVGGAVLERNVRNAKCLVVARQRLCMVGVAALKNTQPSYRKTIKTKAGVAVEAGDFPFELGYIFVLPSARRQGVAVKLCRTALVAADGKGVFATTRSNNHGMNKILAMFSFKKAGRPYASARGEHQLQLFVRYATQPVAADAP